MTTPDEAAAAPEAGQAAITLDGVSRRFGDAVAVDNIDLELPAGEFFALLGPSGCGKTTTLRMVGGFELPTTGRIRLAGKDVTALPPHKRDVNTVFQSYALFPHLSVLENVTFGLRRKRIAKAEAEKRAGDYLDLVGLTGFGARRPLQLSGGQQQRVALARALVNHPKVLLLDEPMGALDAKIRKSMQLELKRIQREVGITFLYVTHDQAEAMSMADRLAVMNAGHVEDLGTPQRVYDRPATQFVAEFLGTCNVLPLVTDAGTARLPDGNAVDVEAAQPPTGAGWKIGIRPEKLALERLGTEGAPASGAPTAPNRTTATVTEVTYLGASTEAHLETPWGTQLQAYKQNTGGDTLIRPGDTVAVSWERSQCFYLPPREGDAPKEAVA
ncbi:ABC transporter ATP-binding protein [Gryllotalpicola daejeonensis]|uniref:ABC transporter ATP-binding protein n=1 Tax=Gryllotalpicola daejeonensis TaxID=993087 RepID=A0ABP7ZGX4_9MICO